MKICKKLLSVTLAAMMLVGMLTVTASAAMPSHGLQSWDNVGSTVEEKNGGVYVMNLYDKSKVEFYFDNAYLSDTPVVLHTVHEDGRFYEDVTVIPLIIQPGCNIYFPDFTAPDEFLEETVGHFLASGYYIRDDGTVEIGGSYEWWFEENNLDNNRNITDDYIVTFEAGDVHYWVKAATADELKVAGFSDVYAGDYYAEAVAWAKETGVTEGTGNGKFSPAATITRAEAMTFLWRAAGKPEPKSTVSPFSDVTNPNAYYYKAVLWAAEQGITTGTGGGKFNLNGTLPYDQILTFLCRAAGESATGSDWSAAAVAWAQESGLTSGLSFTAKANCPRADVVYCLWKQLA